MLEALPRRFQPVEPLLDPAKRGENP